jgi:hypothetical protein
MKVQAMAEDSTDPRNNAANKRDDGLPVGVPFQKGNGGRPKGSRNALGEAFLEAMHDDFVAYGVAAIVEVRETKPDQYLKVIASILPKDLNVNINNMDTLSDDELRARIRSLETVIRPFLASEGVPGASVGSGSETAH